MGDNGTPAEPQAGVPAGFRDLTCWCGVISWGLPSPTRLFIANALKQLGTKLPIETLFIDDREVER
jgi:hypothetical protein